MTAAQERERCVAYLRELALDAADAGRTAAYNALHFAALDIARGDHLRPSDTAGNEA